MSAPSGTSLMRILTAVGTTVLGSMAMAADAVPLVIDTTRVDAHRQQTNRLVNGSIYLDRIGLMVR